MSEIKVGDGLKIGVMAVYFVAMIIELGYEFMRLGVYMDDGVVFSTTRFVLTVWVHLMLFLAVFACTGYLYYQEKGEEIKDGFLCGLFFLICPGVCYIATLVRSCIAMVIHPEDETRDCELLKCSKGCPFMQS